VRLSPCLAALLAVVVLLGGCGGENPGTRVAYTVQAADPAAISGEVAAVLRRRLAAAGVDGASVKVARDEIVISADGDDDRTRATIVALAAPGRLRLYDWEANVIGPDGRPAPADPSVTGGRAAGDAHHALSRHDAVLRAARTPAHATAHGAPARRAIVRAAGPAADRWYVLDDEPAATGQDIDSARPGRDKLADEPVVLVTFTAHGQTAFSRLTARLAHRARRIARAGARGTEANQHFAIVLDDRILATPYIDYRQSPDGIDAAVGTEISGGLTTQEAARVAGLMSSGPLPAKLVPRDINTHP
jgi:preprotein translocase subunit SecD